MTDQVNRWPPRDRGIGVKEEELPKDPASGPFDVFTT
jgi:hypothetical protein